MANLVGSQFVIASDGMSAQQFTTTAQGTDLYLLKANNLSDLPNRNTARQNLGLSVGPLKPVAPEINDLWIDLDS